jgi:hypothetical protein
MYTPRLQATGKRGLATCDIIDNDSGQHSCRAHNISQSSLWAQRQRQLVAILSVY